MRFLLLICVLFAMPAFAVEPEEILDDPILEQRAREISKELRCLVCRNENIDSSNAGVAKDLRLLVRERLVAGDSDDQTISFVVDRYGEYVLLKPPFNFGNAVLWLTGPALLLIGALISIVFIRRRASAGNTSDQLSNEEQEELARIMANQNGD